MATKKNDKTILALKKEIEDQKALLKSSEKFSPVTNLSLELDGQRINLNVLSPELLVQAMVKLHTYQRSAEELGVTEEFKLSGYKPSEWLIDLKAKYAMANRKKETERLKKLEDHLHNLLSLDTKVELEIDALKSEIFRTA